MILIGLPPSKCNEQPVLLWQPAGKVVADLLSDWWHLVEHLPRMPRLEPGIPTGQTEHPLRKIYHEKCFEINRRWFRNKLIPTLPSDFVLRWQLPFAAWLIKNHGYTAQPVHTLEIRY